MKDKEIIDLVFNESNPVNQFSAVKKLNKKYSQDELDALEEYGSDYFDRIKKYPYLMTYYKMLDECGIGIDIPKQIEKQINIFLSKQYYEPAEIMACADDGELTEEGEELVTMTQTEVQRLIKFKNL